MATQYNGFYNTSSLEKILGIMVTFFYPFNDYLRNQIYFDSLTVRVINLPFIYQQ